MGIDTVKVSHGSKVAGGCHLRRERLNNTLSLFLASSVLSIVSLSISLVFVLCFRRFAFGSSRKESRTSILSLSLSLSSGFVFLFSFYVRACQHGLVRPPTLMEEPSLFLHLVSFPRLVETRIRAKFRFATVETGRGIFIHTLTNETSKISKVNLYAKISLCVFSKKNKKDRVLNSELQVARNNKQLLFLLSFSLFLCFY